MFRSMYGRIFGEGYVGFFAEIGAFNGYTQSVGRYLVEQRGWGGVMVEPNPEAADECERRYADNSEVLVIRKGIAKRKGRAKLFLGGTLSTFVPNRVKLYNRFIGSKKGWGVKKMSKDEFVEVEVDTLENVLDSVGRKVDVMSVDVEGMELEVLESSNWEKHAPMIVQVETHDKNDNKALRKNSRDLDDFMVTVGYDKIWSNTVNTLYERRM